MQLSQIGPLSLIGTFSLSFSLEQQAHGQSKMTAICNKIGNFLPFDACDKKSDILKGFTIRRARLFRSCAKTHTHIFRELQQKDNIFRKTQNSLVAPFFSTTPSSPGVWFTVARKILARRIKCELVSRCCF